MIFCALLLMVVVILVYRRLTPENSWKQVDFKMHCPNCLYRYYLLLIVMDHNLLFDHKRSSCNGERRFKNAKKAIFKDLNYFKG